MEDIKKDHLFTLTFTNEERNRDMEALIDLVGDTTDLLVGRGRLTSFEKEMLQTMDSLISARYESVQSDMRKLEEVFKQCVSKWLYITIEHSGHKECYIMKLLGVDEDEERLYCLISSKLNLVGSRPYSFSLSYSYMDYEAYCKSSNTITIDEISEEDFKKIAIEQTYKLIDRDRRDKDCETLISLD